MKILTKPPVLLLPAVLLGFFGVGNSSTRAAGFTDSHLTFYGEVRQVGGAGTMLLQSGELELTFANQSDSANRVTLKTQLRPTGAGAGSATPWSYFLRVPLAYLPAAREKERSLALGSQSTDFRIESITINGVDASLPDGSHEFFSVSFASRAGHQRLDLIIQGDSTDSDGDGLPDWWEEIHGLDPQNSDSGADPDEDGWSNLEEFRRGASPLVSNREPTLVTTEIVVPESGQAGVLLHLLDSDASSSEIEFTLTLPASDGFSFKLDGTPVTGNELTLRAVDLESGRLTVGHTSKEVRERVMHLSFPGAATSAAIAIRSSTPSLENGNDAALWLDAATLDFTGQSSVDRWLDRSGNERDAFQPSTEYQPITTLHDSGHATLDFSRSSHAHLFFQDVALPAGDHTILAAYETGASATSTQTLFASNRGFFQLSSSTEAISYPGSPLYQADGVAVRGYENLLGHAATTSMFRLEGALLQHIFGHSYDGEARATSNLDPLLPTLGARRSALPGTGNPVSEPFQGKLHELLVFPVALQEQKLRDVHDYLESKWSEAVIWDFATELRAASLVMTSGDDRKHIIRGGHGNDVLAGGPSGDVISGGPGDDLLRGGGGADQFVFGGVDTGRDTIADFELETDIIDLSAHFWDRRGDARDFLSVRLETNFSHPIPTLDSILVFDIPGEEAREIILQNAIVGGPQLVQLIVEGRIRMGGLTIPAEVQLARSSGPGNIREHLGESFEIELTRTGDSSAAALEVPIGLFRDALGTDLVIEEASSREGQRAVVTFARGEISKTVTVRALGDLGSEGSEVWELTALPHFRYSLTGDSTVLQSVSDVPNVWLEVIEADAIAGTSQQARVRIRRDGDLETSLSIPVTFGGTAIEGTHFAEIPDLFEIAVGADSIELTLEAIPGSLADQGRVALVQLGPAPSHQLIHPHEAAVYLVEEPSGTENLGFERWLAANRTGNDRPMSSLSRSELAQALASYVIEAHALGFRVIDGHPELSLSGTQRPDITWSVEGTNGLQHWQDLTSDFSRILHGERLTFRGPQLEAEDPRAFFRLRPRLTAAQMIGHQIASLTGSSRHALYGSGTWQGDILDGEITSRGGTDSRILAEIDGPATLDFQMAIRGAAAGDSFRFLIDGVVVEETAGAEVHVQQTLEGTGSHLLTWVFQRSDSSSSSEAVIQTPN